MIFGKHSQKLFKTRNEMNVSFSNIIRNGRMYGRHVKLFILVPRATVARLSYKESDSGPF